MENVAITLDKEEAKGTVQLVEHPYGMMLYVNGREIGLLDLFSFANKELEKPAARLIVFGKEGEPAIIVRFAEFLSAIVDKSVIEPAPALCSSVDEYEERGSSYKPKD